MHKFFFHNNRFCIEVAVEGVVGFDVFTFYKKKGKKNAVTM